MTNKITKDQLLNAINTNSDIVIDEGSLHLVVSAYQIAPHHARAKGEFQLAIMGDDVEINGQEVKIDSADYDIRATELTAAHVEEVNDWVAHFRKLAMAAVLDVSDAAAAAIEEVYNYLFGDQWTLDSVEGDYGADYIGIFEAGGRAFAHYFDDALECGVWVDTLDHMTDEEIEKYL